MSTPLDALRGQAAPPAVSLAWLTFAGICAPLGFNFIGPLLPAIQAYFNTGPGQTQGLVSVYALSMGLAQLFTGPMADAWGRRAVLLGGLALYTCAALAASFADTFEHLLWLRGLQAVGACTCLVVPRAAARDLYSGLEAARAIAIVTIALSLTPAIAPIVGGTLLFWFEWRAGFAACAVMGLATLLLAWRFHPETLPQARRVPLHPVTLMQTYARIAGNWRFHAYVMSYSALNCGFIGFIVTGPAVLMRQEGLSAWGVAVLLLVVYLGFALGNLYAARHVRRTGVDRMIAYGIGISLLGSALLLPGVRMGGIAAIVLPLFINCVGNGLSFPTGIAGAVNLTPDRAGTAAALVSGIQLMVGAAFAWFCGGITGGDLMPFSWACLGASIAGGLFALPLYLARTPKQD